MIANPPRRVEQTTDLGGESAMVEHAVPTDVVDAGDDLRADVEYLGRHPLVRYACAAAALSASMFAVTRTIRAQGTRERVAFAAFAIITAGQAAGLVWALPAMKSVIAPDERPPA
jgi:hypothetical protein